MTWRHRLTLALLALVPSCATPLHQRIRVEWSGATPGLTAVPLDVRPSNHAYVDGEVNGISTAMLIDTGAAMSVIEHKLAERLALKELRSVTVSGTGGLAEGALVRLDRVRIGELTLHGVFALTLDLAELESRLGATIPMILGRGLFENTVVELDYPGARFVCHDRRTFRYDGPGRTVKLEPNSSNLKNVACRIENLPPAMFQLDTGSGQTVSVFAEYTTKHALLEGRTPQTRRLAGGIGGFGSERAASFGSFALAGYAMPDVPASFPQPESGSFVGRRFAGNLGGAILRRFRLFIDFSRHRMHVEPGPQLAAPFPRNRLGVGTRVRADSLRIIHIAPGSPAARSELTKGADLVAVDGRTGSPIELFRLLYAASRQPEGAVVRLRDSDGVVHRIVLATHY